MAKQELYNLSEQELEKLIQRLSVQRDAIVEEQREIKAVLSRKITERYEARRIEVENDPKLKALSQGVVF